MVYNPRIHHRRSIRLKEYDYAQAGLYFITINVQHLQCLFGSIKQQQMILNNFGVVAQQQWAKLPERFSNVALDAFQIMPNHMHGILLLTNAASVGAGLAPPQSQDAPAQQRAGASRSPTRNATVGDIIGAYKSQVANICLALFKQEQPGVIMGKLWQRNYYEHVIRNEQSFQRIAQYITNNPAKWDEKKWQG